MSQRIATCTSSLRVSSRVQTLFLCICLLIPLAWYESDFSVAARLASASTAVSEDCDGQSKPAVHKNCASHRLLASLIPAPSLAQSSGLYPENRDDDPSVTQFSSLWTIVDKIPHLPSLRIDPIAWDNKTPSFLLPSAHGLVSFAIPPPLRSV